MRNPFTDRNMELWITVCTMVVGGVFMLVVVVALVAVGLDVAGVPSGGEVKPSKTMTVVLPDSRRVQCIKVDAGVSCDWPHASGADKDDMGDAR